MEENLIFQICDHCERTNCDAPHWMQHGHDEIPAAKRTKAQHQGQLQFLPCQGRQLHATLYRRYPGSQKSRVDDFNFFQELRIVEGTEAADDYFCADDAVETRTQFPNSLADEPEASGDFNLFDDQISDDEEVGVSSFHRAKQI